MKRNAVVRIVCYSLITLVLLGIMLTGLGVGMLSFDLGSDHSGSYLTDEIGVEASQIQNIEIEWVCGDIDLRIATDGSQEIRVCETRDDDKDPKAVWEIKGQTLVIKYSQPTINIGFVSTPDKDLTVIFPAGWQCEELDIETVSGSVNISLLDASRIELESVSADCLLTCNAKEVSLNTVSGNLEYRGVVEKLECEAVSADCTILPDNAPKQIKLEAISGDLIVGLFEDTGFTTHLDSVSGNIYSDFSTSSIGADQVYGDGSCQITADTVSGDIEIKKMEYRLTD